MIKINGKYSYLKILKFFLIFIRRYLWLELVVVLLIGLSIGLNLSLPLINRLLIDDAITSKNIALLYKILLLYVVVFISGELINITMDYLQNIVQEKISVDIFQKLFRKLLNMEMIKLENYSNTEILNIFLMDAESVKSLIADFLITVLTQSIYFIGILIIMLKLSSILTFWALLPVPFYILAFIIFNSKIRKVTKDVRKEFDKITFTIDETFQGISEIRTYNSKKRVYKQFESKLKLLYHKLIKSSLQGNFVEASINILSTLGSLILWFYGGYLIIHDKLTLGTLFALTSYINQLYGPINILAGKNFKIQASMIGLEKIYAFLQEKEESESKGVRIEDFKESISISALSFNYPSGKEVIKNLNLDIKKGDKILLKGSNGSGKSTLLKILLGIYKNYRGDIKIDGVDLKKVSLMDYRNLIAYVPQVPFIFEGSLKENVSLRNSNSNLDYFKKFFSKFHFVKIANNENDLKIKSGGKNLSGGQRQQISMLRSFYKNARIIVIDEGTSNIDLKTNLHIDEHIKKYFSDKTIIRVSHNRSANYDNYKTINLDNINIMELPKKERRKFENTSNYDQRISL